MRFLLIFYYCFFDLFLNFQGLFVMGNKIDFIYIVESESQIPPASRFNIHKETYTSNFTMAGAEDRESSISYLKRISASKKTSLLIAAASFYSGPLSLLTMGVSSIALSNLFSMPPESKEDSVKMEVAEKEVYDFLVNHAITADMASSLSFNFPPGHPRVGCSYRLHPLANCGIKEKRELYIPEEKFDEILFEEREAELIRLLVNLGATSIAISEQDDLDASLSLGVDTVVGSRAFGANASVNHESSNIMMGGRQREFVLNPLKNKNPRRICHEEYSWVSFEPSWQSIIFSREVGRCTKASLILKEKTVFSNKKTGSVGFDGKLADASIDGRLEKRHLVRKNYVIEVSFYDQDS
ncbi:hypothetical protein NFH98_12895 [Halomonas sp. H33-56]|uniref:hypothetical protein n=1 Tax=Halomonas sp. H33-56 TaxID=2950873 RepID=UPI0032DECD4D